MLTSSSTLSASVAGFGVKKTRKPHGAAFKGEANRRSEPTHPRDRYGDVLARAALEGQGLGGDGQAVILHGWFRRQALNRCLEPCVDVEQPRAALERVRAAAGAGSNGRRRLLRDARDLGSRQARRLAASRNQKRRIEREGQALLNALCMPFSNGPVEGAVNRIKLFKRQMYGRGSLELLKKRVLLAA